MIETIKRIYIKNFFSHGNFVKKKKKKKKEKLENIALINYTVKSWFLS